MRIRRFLAAAIAAAAFAGLGLTGAVTAHAASLTPGECTSGGGTVDWSKQQIPHTGTCVGGTQDGKIVD
ncbi:hypothetical protein [Streptomyces fuscichromogenes]|uniref:Secreted protein n=1 Tax=Streptomyces fuscichromogenes TaxID=1324013 RepID=A0A917XEE5_9ACTN|nr:hypothetical protein [Streptomyces fuscichromogenes]GGN16494.1 hypothetical protein GCM10011578_045010 [Streptomyces fuscichromogenes]